MGLFAVLGVAACGGGGRGGPAPQPTPSLGTGPAACAEGLAEDFPCSGIDLARRLPPGAMGGAAGNDVWGWADGQTGREYALMGLNNGTAFVDVTDPEAPVFLGRLPTQTRSSAWRDIKVYRDHAYIVADDAGAHGLQVFDLTRLRGLASPGTFSADVVVADVGSAHNLAINEDTGYAYVVGGTACHGVQIFDISTPKNPLRQSCYELVDTHDAQCVTYAGPDPGYAGAELCMNSNGDHFQVLDVTAKGSPVSLAQLGYPGLGFVHQGWLSDDQRYFLLGDEFDELSLGNRTRTHVFDLSNVDAPVYLGAYEAGTGSTDHNLYVLGDRVYEANYRSGLRVLQINNLASVDLSEIAFFDTVPGSEAPGFRGAWSVYPYLPSGTILVSDTVGGLFVLVPQ
jgi:choice-of-anchor B domain-containing protein